MRTDFGVGIRIRELAFPFRSLHPGLGAYIRDLQLALGIGSLHAKFAVCKRISEPAFRIRSLHRRFGTYIHDPEPTSGIRTLHLDFEACIQFSEIAHSFRNMDLKFGPCNRVSEPQSLGTGKHIGVTRNRCEWFVAMQQNALADVDVNRRTPIQ